jgi:hypothetical protein
MMVNLWRKAQQISQSVETSVSTFLCTATTKEIGQYGTGASARENLIIDAQNVAGLKSAKSDTWKYAQEFSPCTLKYASALENF